MNKRSALISVALLLFTACGGKEVQVEEYNPSSDFNLTEHFPKMDVPPDNPMDSKKINLGRQLFFETALSKDSSISCASCHKPSVAFADTLQVSAGVNGRKAKRNTPSLINVGHYPHLMRDGGPQNLELQILVPLQSEDEMNLSIREACNRLNSSESYHKLFLDAFDTNATPFTITRAIAAYERTLIGGNSRYDLFLKGDSNALTQTERRGYNLFFSERLNCGSCHNGVFLTNFQFENNGTHAEYADNGRFRLTLRESDIGKFKVASLRNVSLTAPYMFDGSFSTLNEVISHYESGGQPHPNKSTELKGFKLNNEERMALIQFFEALTDVKR